MSEKNAAMPTKKVGMANKFTKSKVKDGIFYAAMTALPLLQFLIFYVGVNFNSILLAFQNINSEGKVVGWGFGNFVSQWKILTADSTLADLTKLSVLMYVLNVAFGIVLGLFFSYYISKKMPLSGMFRVVLFLPSIVSSIVFVVIYEKAVNFVLPDLMKKLFKVKVDPLLLTEKTRTVTIIVYNLIVSFGTNVLMFSNAMTGISPEIVDAAKLDGATGVKEFRYVTVPCVYPTISTFIIIGVAGIFTNQMNLYSFQNGSVDSNAKTFGYYLYKLVADAQYTDRTMDYTSLSALGLMYSVVALPLTFGVKFLVEKFGFKED